MVVLTLVDDLGNMAIEGAFDLLLNRASGISASVIASWIFTPFDLFLAIFPPVIAVICWLVNRCREDLGPPLGLRGGI